MKTMAMENNSLVRETLSICEIEIISTGSVTFALD
jgi:hypothetical protein